MVDCDVNCDVTECNVKWGLTTTVVVVNGAGGVGQRAGWQDGAQRSGA